MFQSPVDHKIYGSVTVNAKGQIVIPSEARERLGLKQGDQLLVTSKGDFLLGLIKADNLQEFATIIEQDSPGFFENCKKDIHLLQSHISSQK